MFVAGTVLMRSAGCCVNDVADREFDRHVKRTAQRPVTSGAVGSEGGAGGRRRALAFAAFALVLTTTAPAIVLSFAALAVTLLYPYAKRVLNMPQAVLGVAFSFGIPMAFAAAQGGMEWSLRAVADAVPPHAWLLLLGNLFWVLAYDTEYAMVDRDDDLRIGMKTSAITLGRFDVVGVMAFYGVYLASWALLGRCAGAGHGVPRRHRRGGRPGAVALDVDPWPARARAASRPSAATTGSASRCSPAWPPTWP